MKRSIGNILFALLATATLAGTAAAEKTLTVNDNNTGVFDQPSVVMNGSVGHVVYIGGDNASGPFRVFHAAVNAASDFTNMSLVRDNTTIPSFQLLIDNAGSGGNSPYYDARHPRIVLRTSSEVVVLFQAKRDSLSLTYRPFLARLSLSSNVATLLSVKEVTGFPASAPDLGSNDLEDFSAGINTTDNTLRIAFSAKSAIGAAERFQVYFARVGIDNATVVGTPLLLSTLEGSGGFRPIPSLRLDGQFRAHIAWVSNDNALSPNPVYYAMVKEVSGADNVVIAASQIISATMRWGHPQVMVSNDSSIIILAVDESTAGVAGNIGLVNINPDADNQDGTSVQVGTNTTFFLTPPGELILSDEFNLYRPEAFLDSLGKIHMTGYGSGGSNCIYYAFHLISSSPYHEITTARAQVGVDVQETPGQIDGDYTRAAFGHFEGGRALVFWSGIVGGSNRNMDVTAIPTSTALPSDESGCSMVSDPRTGERDRIAGTALLFLPALVLAGRRILTGRRGRPRRIVG